MSTTSTTATSTRECSIMYIEIQLLMVCVYTESTLPTFTESPPIGETYFSENCDHILSVLTRNDILSSNVNMWVKILTRTILYCLCICSSEHYFNNSHINSWVQHYVYRNAATNGICVHRIYFTNIYRATSSCNWWDIF